MTREKQIEMAYDNARKNNYTSIEAITAFIEGMNQEASIEDLVKKIELVINEGVKNAKYNNVFNENVDRRVKNLRFYLDEFIKEYKRPA
jgi:hypothetical protein